MDAAQSLCIAVTATLIASVISQFPVTDGTNDLFAVLTHCNIQPPYPPDNEYTCHRTNMEMNSGFTFCDPQFVRQRSISIADETDSYTIFYVHSPGRLQGRDYSNRLLCRWSVRCPANQQMYLDIVEHVLEPHANSPFFSNPVCLDFLRISRDFGDQVFCGEVPPMDDLEPNRLLVEFRSNFEGRYPGFRMRVVCFDPIAQNSTGCTISEDASPQAQPSLNLTAMDDQSIQANQTRMARETMQGNRFEQLSIAKNESVIYANQGVYIVLNNTILRHYPAITSFHTYNEFDGVTSYYKRYDILSFRGFGVLTVVDYTAYYVIYGLDPQFLPSVSEQSIIRVLLDAEEVLIQDEDEPIPELRVMPPGRDKRTTSAGTGPFEPSVVAMAQASQNSCNAVLRSVAQSILRNADAK